MAIRKYLDDNGKIITVDDEEPLKKPPATRKEAIATGQPRSARQAAAAPLTTRTPTDDARDRAKMARALSVQSNPVYGALNLVGGDKAIDLAERFGSGALMGLETRIGAGARAIKEKFAGKDFTDTYAQELAAQRALSEERKQRTGLAGDVAEFGGALVTPIKGAGVGIKAAKALRGAKAAVPLSRAGTAFAGGIGAGVTSGAAEGLARSEDWTDIGETAENTARGAVLGGATGGVLGAAATPLGAAGRAIVRKTQGARGKNAAALEAARAADELVLKGVERGGGIPRAENQIQNMVEQGTNPITADVNPQLQQQLKALVDKGTPGAEDVAGQLTDRAALRGGRLKKKISELSNVEDSMTSAARQRDMAAARQAQNQQGYAIGGILEEPIHIPRALRRQLSPSGQPKDETFKGIYEQAQRDYNADFQNPRLRKLKKGEDPTANATVRVMDMALKQYRGKINSLFQDPATAGRAKALRSQFNVLRERMRDVHPEFGKLLDEHALMIGKERAAQIGDKLGPKLFSDPRKVMDVISNPQAHDIDPGDLIHLREALADRAFGMAERKAGSVADEIRLATADPANRAEANSLWEFILNGPQKVDEVNKWIKAEKNAMETEKKLLTGSPTSTNIAGLQQQANDVEQTIINAGRTVAGVASNSPGIWLNALGLTTKYGGRVIKGRDLETVEKLQLKRLMRRAERGDLTRMQARAEREAAKKAAITQRRMNRIGRIAAQPISPFTPKSLPDTEDEEYQ